MVRALALALVLAQPDILKCHRDSHGQLTVMEEQWNYIHQELATWEPGRVLPLIHPKRGLTLRVVVTSRPKPNGEIIVSREHKTRADIAVALKGAKDGYDVYHPGYTFNIASQMIPGRTQVLSDSGSGRVLMKGAMLYWDEAVSQEDAEIPLAKNKKLAARRYRRDFNRFSPTTYITVFCDGGRLWLSVLSSDWPGE
ncbi:MAG: hypothetical protein ACHQ50_14915 [Fimbriimonadales bacterium]